MSILTHCVLVIIGETTAEHVKEEIGAAVYKKQSKKDRYVEDEIYLDDDEKESKDSKKKSKPADEPLKVEVRGRNVANGVPETLKLTSEEIEQALADPLMDIVRGVKDALEQTPPELSADIAERGIVLTGGGALLKGFDKLLSKETGLPVTVAEDPLTCVGRGGGQALDFVDDKRLNTIFS